MSLAHGQRTDQSTGRRWSIGPPPSPGPTARPRTPRSRLPRHGCLRTAQAELVPLQSATHPLRAARLVLSLALLVLTAGAAPPAHPWAPPVPGRVAAPFHRPEERWLAGHRGIDLDARALDTVRAPRDGVVAFAGTVVDRPVVVVAHADGSRSTLEPVTATVSVGTQVARGDALGTVGPQPGHCAPGTCVHWGVRVGDDYLDPALLLEGVQIVLLPLRR